MSFSVRGGRVVPTGLASAPRSGSGTELVGLPGAPGRACGARAVCSEVREAVALIQPGDVLVIRQADVGWTPLFGQLGGLVTELGGPLSHACVIARELALPVVANLAGATASVRTGDSISIDGDRGTVRIEGRWCTEASVT